MSPLAAMTSRLIIGAQGVRGDTPPGGMGEQDRLTLWVGATRYYLGRTSHAVSSYCELLRREWPSLPAHAREIIRGDIEDEFARDDRSRADGATYRPLGHDCDRASWETVRGLWRTP